CSTRMARAAHSAGADPSRAQMNTAARSPRSHRAGYVLPLRGLGRTDRTRAGTKAANLGELVNASFPVPDGFVLTADAFGRFLAANRLGAEASADSIAAARLPPDLSDELVEAASAFGDMPLAVRSSGVNED